MHKMILGNRLADAHKRVVAAAKAVAEEYETAKPAADKLAKAFDKDPQVKQLYETEALAELLEAVVTEMNAPEEPPAPAPKSAAKTAK